MNPIKIKALKVSFLDILIERWYEDYQGKTIKDFIENTINEYLDVIHEYTVPGETGVYIDHEALHKLNNYQPRGGKAEWDLECSRIIFGTDENPGLFTYDNEGNKTSINALQSSDIRIWNYLSIFVLGKFTINRWGDSQDAVRLFVKSLSNNNVSRHSIMRLYWSAKICYDQSKSDKLELLPTLWKTEDFMTQVTERSTAGMQNQIRYLLEYCSIDKNESLFSEKSSDGYAKYRKMLKLLLADSNVMALPLLHQNEMNMLLRQNFEACN